MLRLFGNPLFVACFPVTCVVLAAAFLSMIQMVPEYRWGELFEMFWRFMQIYFPSCSDGKTQVVTRRLLLFCTRFLAF
jgi:hypothetical protein